MELLEEWKRFRGDYSYKISSLGRFSKNGKILRGHVDRAGYVRVAVWQDGIRRLVYVHRIVAEAFCSGTGCEVNHKNCDKSDNKVENLEWCTRKENMAHAGHMGCFPNRKGSKHPGAKFTEEQVQWVRQFKQWGVSLYAFKLIFPSSIAALSDIYSGRTWNHI